MDNPTPALTRFFGVVGSGRAYLNALYLLLAFPLGLFYFVFLAAGLLSGIALSIVIIGIPILLLVAGGWWLLAAFERQMAIHILQQEIPPMSRQAHGAPDILGRLKGFASNPVTWKSFLYLGLKFPLGILGFVVVVFFGALIGTMLFMPVTYETFQFSIDLGFGLPLWQIDSIDKAVTLSVFGLLLWPVALHAANGLAFIHGWLAKHMLGLKEQVPVEVSV
jgi:hypothetical protein